MPIYFLWCVHIKPPAGHRFAPGQQASWPAVQHPQLLAIPIETDKLSGMTEAMQG